ncbi:PAS domain-containing protein [Rhodobacteraceae bacterium 2CG4]|uniref:PAS domain-containing protein n=1 Tax=Halovulum marinum TaxID=2662447 RepID=A0A6L5Z4G7_9RHOB|nr:PAS domain-containing protein [Halovulum marinum]MSU91347.1 PAS domain-containing protein [Halovulum marinum]
MPPIRLTLQPPNRAEYRGLMAALDAAQCLIWFAPSGRIEAANANAQGLLDMPLEDLRTLSLTDLANDGDKPGQAAYFRRHWARVVAGQLRCEERALIDRHGDEIWCSLTYAPLRDDDGEVRLVCALIINMSRWSWRPPEAVGRVY